ncbi:hypothetical protein [Duganella violaceipulchra]|uniref:Uncharacterized protein n=1 Tax=Duganella violaceipulchra TaxID=2849652 RepID=A0AA41HB92_9BURK|nr:hypothetical protein [Duganella violaceicalia]MBV6322940.1 hypothetical protein [Duganella violaceicalia]MCP2008021.1 hypothetical protein [Duganella violaceicalia]
MPKGLPLLEASGGFDGGGAELEEAMQFDLSVMYASHYKRAASATARAASRQGFLLVSNKTTELFLRLQPVKKVW